MGLCIPKVFATGAGTVRQGDLPKQGGEVKPNATTGYSRERNCTHHCGSSRALKYGRSRGKQTCRCGQRHYRFARDGNRHYCPETVKTQAVRRTPKEWRYRRPSPDTDRQARCQLCLDQKRGGRPRRPCEWPGLSVGSLGPA